MSCHVMSKIIPKANKSGKPLIGIPAANNTATTKNEGRGKPA